jgi:threonine dehydrogenase-like Zn-dependent dehydrogenase
MLQVLQSLADGRTILAEVPVGAAARGGLLVRTTRSLISAGTERMLVEFGRAGWIDKARQQPEKLRQVLDKVRADGVLPTVDAVRSKLDQLMPLGYCNVGRVAEVGADVRGFAVGDRVVSNGPHAEFVAVPRNLCARVPDDVADDEAVFTVLGAIALQGVRLTAPTLGERFVVTGLGLLGLLSVQLLRANGCRVLGIDPDPTKTELARRFGADVVELERGEDPLAVAEVFSGGAGVDGVLITASTRSNDPVSQGARMCRQRGRIVLVGVTGLDLDRSDFYQKELSFQVSCSYGPGRYDPAVRGSWHRLPSGVRALDGTAQFSGGFGDDEFARARRADIDHAPLRVRRGTRGLRASRNPVSAAPRHPARVPGAVLAPRRSAHRSLRSRADPRGGGCGACHRSHRRRQLRVAHADSSIRGESRAPAGHC